MFKNKLKSLGYDEWFEALGKKYVKDGFSIARIIEVSKNIFKINDGHREMSAEITGKFLFETQNNTDFPTVGDWVIIKTHDEYKLAIIHGILARKSVLKRKKSGKDIDFQLISANIDYALIVHAADSNFNLNRLERYLVMVNENKIKPIIILTKLDLISERELTEVIKQIETLNTKYLLISNISGQGMLELTNILESEKTYCLLGPSGVGKTTLLNKLVGKDLFKVSEVREKDGKGRHTTVKRQLICLKSGCIFIDTPGMKELGNFSINDGIDETFDDILPYTSNCHFTNCSHTNEKGCAVIEAVEEGTLDSERYKNFLKIKKESSFYDLSYLQKRKKDKTFGKIIKNYKKFTKKHT